MTVSDQQRQSAIAGNAVEIADGEQVFYLLSKRQYDELQRVRLLLGEIEEIEFSPYVADDLDDPHARRSAFGAAMLKPVDIHTQGRDNRIE